MSHCRSLLFERNPVLVVVGSLLHQAPDLHQFFCQFQKGGIARSPVHLRHPHVMGGTDGISGQFLRRRPRKFHQETGSLPGNLQQGVFPCHPVMNTGCCHQVAQVVGFKIEPSRKFIPGSRIFGRFDQRGCMEVPVGTLGFPDNGDDPVNLCFQLLVP